MASEQKTWRLESLQYLGEISALCFIPLPHLSPSPYLLAGTGSQVLVYDVEAGKILNSFHVFDGIRVHGISCSFTDLRKCRPSLTAGIKIAVFGERRVKLFSLHFDMMSDYLESHKVNVNLLLINVLPRLSHWVMDVSFLKDHMLCKCEVDNHLAVGLSNNSVCLWDISRSNMVVEVKCPERCLLYSMRLWGDSIKALRVASGTIYNENVNGAVLAMVCLHFPQELNAHPGLAPIVKEAFNPVGQMMEQIIVWKLSQQTPTSACLMEGCNHTDSSSFKSSDLYDQKFDAILLGRLTGHEGSIFRISWSSDGSKLLSASDDRSVRVWNVGARIADSNEESVSVDVSVNLTLFGHNARVWDCYISDSLIISAGEDCTCRVWSLDGSQLTMIKEHVGRGIWRCLYDQSSSLLITAGFDSAIKVHTLQSSLFRNKNEHDKIFKKLKDRTEVFKIEMPNVSEELGLMDSKSEYVRCLRFVREDVLYVATNHGYLYHVKLCGPGNGNVEWTKLIQIGEKVPVICMDLLQSNLADFSKDVEDWIVVGDGAGDATVVRVIDGACAPKIDLCFTWSAEKERQLLGAYWCKSLGCSYLFTADPRGRLKLWKVDIITTKMPINLEVSLVAYFTSCFGARILCMDASFEEEVLVCGDQRGNLIMFPLFKSLLLASSMKSEENISSLTYFKGAHGISSVSSIVITTFNFKEVEICTTGGDGCICSFKYNKDWRSLEFMGMNQVKELSLIQSVFSNACFVEDLAHGNYAIGFASADFIIWNLVNETKILLVPCGGWRRPHSYFLGEVPEIQNCFAYLKDHTVHVHRLWVSANDRKQFPQVLHMQYHGREIHSLCFVSVGLQIKPTTKNDHQHELSWVATGCEDGTVRLTRYNPLDFAGWSASKLLGEHVGGSAVRSMCFVSKTQTAGHTYTNCGDCSNDAIVDGGDTHCLLISVGAKRVLTSWLLGNNSHKKAAPIQGAVQTAGNMRGLEFQSMSFQWLSTHMPPKFASRSGGHKSIDNAIQLSGQGKNASVIETSSTSAAYISENQESRSKSSQDDQSENDWRYMAVTAFLVKSADSRLTICFIVVACSDATLTLRALLLPSRLWFDVALLVPQTSPVLTLQHLVIPVLDPSEGQPQVGNQYIVISGSTDGNIAFWDLTDTVESFMQKVLMLQPEKLIDCHRRPRTGRGSQGGRRWRSLTNQSTQKGDVADKAKVREDADHGTVFQDGLDSSELRNKHSDAPIISTQSANADNFSVPEVQSNEHLNGVQKIWPMHVVKSVHQSGVNCLHVSAIKNFQHSDSKSVHCVISGGDDQALNCLVFDLPLSLTSHDNGLQQPMKSTKPTDFSDPGEMRKPSLMRFFCNDRISSAHSSAVKGVWTDGAWVFSCGLDQRIRCWNLGENGKLIEHAHLVISVPEPEALDARPCSSLRKQYQIVIAGRGMQMVQFSASCIEDHAQ